MKRAPKKAPTTRRPPKAPPEIPGWTVRRVHGTGPGDPTFTLVEVDYWADPDRDEAWAKRQRAMMGSERAWKREFMRDWTTAAGTPFYPEFVTAPTTFVRRAVNLLPGPVVRGWDFGYRKPACCWMQYSHQSQRLFVFRELMPENLDTYAFRDLVLWCSGQRDLGDLRGRSRAIEWARKLRDGKHPPPWFPVGTTFIDYAGPEALQRTASVEHEAAARTDADILALEDIQLEVYSVRLAAREQVIRRLLQARPDGVPGLLFDPSCKLLIEGFNGGISYPDETPGNKTPTNPRKDGIYEHLHDALGYAASQIVPVDESFTPRRYQDGDLIDGFDWTT